MIIAVDGVAASGKGTIAGALARHYRLPHLDTGLLYRAVALNLLQARGSPDNAADLAKACDLSEVDFADPALKAETTGGVASQVSRFEAVRSALFARQKAFAAQSSGAVLDGRDIGTVIAPDAHAKLFVTASPHTRATRRTAELARAGQPQLYAAVLADILARDAADSERKTAPLTMAADAVLLDTSDLDIAAAIAQAIALVEARLRGG